MSLPTSFKAAVVPHAKAQHAVTERSLSALAADEVAVRVTATAINPADWKFRDQDAFIPEYPAVVGTDAAGEVVAVGADVRNFVVGERVFFQGMLEKGYPSSTFQQYCKMPASLLARTPSAISDEQAAGIQLATMAVVTGFYDSTGFGLSPPWAEGGREAGTGKAIVIIGGSSSVGQYAIQMARLSGFERIITNASSAHVEYLKSLGAHIVLDRQTQSAAHDFGHALGNDSGLTLLFVFDSIGTAATLMLGVNVLQLAGAAGATLVRPCGGIVEDFASLAAGRGGVVPREVAEQSQQGKKVAIKAILGLGSLPHLRYLSEPLSKHLGGEDGYLANGDFTPNRPVVVPGGLEAVEAALLRNKQGVSGKKVVIRLCE